MNAWNKKMTVFSLNKELDEVKKNNTSMTYIKGNGAG